MKVSDILEITNPVYINHMIVLTTVDSSSLSYWLPFFLDGQCELHHLALVFLQLILDRHCGKFSTHSGPVFYSLDPRFLRLIQQGEGPWLKKGEASSF